MAPTSDPVTSRSPELSPLAPLSAKVRTHRGFYSRFLQQELPAYRLIPGARALVAVPGVLGTVIFAVGIALIVASRQVVEVQMNYSDDPWCVFQHGATNGDVPCAVTAQITKDMRAPVHVHYGVDRFHQNSRGYARSVAYNQYHFANRSFATSELYPCIPELFLGSDGYGTEGGGGGGGGGGGSGDDTSRAALIRPCGLVAWTFFNDTYQLDVTRTTTNLTERVIAFDDDNVARGIARPADLSLFGPVVAQNFNPPEFSQYRGGSTVTRPLNENERFISWMRLAARPAFRKPYARIGTNNGEIVFRAGDVVSVAVHNRFNVYQFGGTKSFVLTTLSWYGGRHDGAGYVFIGAGLAMIVLAAMLATLVFYTSGPYARPSCLKIKARAYADVSLIGAK